MQKFEDKYLQIRSEKTQIQSQNSSKKIVLSKTGSQMQIGQMDAIEESESH